MKKLKKVISFVMLMIIFLSSAQSIVFGAISINKADLKKGNNILSGVQFNAGAGWYEITIAHYIYYKDKQHPAYCIDYRRSRCR